MRRPICCSSSSVSIEVRRDHDRALLLVALVDERVELLEHPVGLLLGAEVVEVQQVDVDERRKNSDVRALAAVGVVGVADLGQQARDGVDRDRVTRA